MAFAWTGWWHGRRRSALNRALHELRRPLQSLLLSVQRPARASAAVPSSLALVSAALADLDREINGECAPRVVSAAAGTGASSSAPAEASCRDLLRAAEARWRYRAEVAGGSLQLRWRAGADFWISDPERVAQALDNLIDNSIEHGGGEVTIDASRSERGVRLAVCDRGTGFGGSRGGGSPGSVIARLTGRRRRGHGLAVVRELAAAQRGRFFLRPSPWGTRAMLEIPVRESLPPPE